MKVNINGVEMTVTKWSCDIDYPALDDPAYAGAGRGVLRLYVYPNEAKHLINRMIEDEKEEGE